MRHHTLRKIILIFFAGLLLSLAWGIFSSYHLLTVTEYDICSDKVAGDVSVVLISDLHNHSFGRSNAALVKKIRKLQPDLILMAGDYLNSDSPDAHVLLELIPQLAEITSVYYSLGNQENDYINRVDGKTLITDIESVGAVVLDKEYIKTQVNGTELVIGGIYEYAFGQDGYGNMDKTKIPEDTLSFLESFQTEQSFKIMMAHRPESFLFSQAKETWDIDLVLSGHLHGGHVIIPFKGGLYGGDFGWFPKYAYGEFHFSGVKTMIITRGLGSGHQKLPRFNNMPELVLIRLRGE
ncbi:MAG: metallophosphoesterase [Parasporobacterium sp.]|nr:metallophosphoesterase [Parasporobacterium sp.]